MFLGTVFAITVTILFNLYPLSNFSVSTTALITPFLPGKIGASGCSATVHEQEPLMDPKTKG